MLKLDNISISFGNKQVLQNTGFVAYENALTIIQGKSGTGKSTFLDALLFKHQAQYIYNEKKLDDISDEQKQSFLFNTVSIVYQIPIFIDQLTVQEHIDFQRKLYSLKEDIKYYQELGIGNMLDKYPSQLSGGERTRVSIYLGLLKQPSIFVLDEPTASLDKYNKEIVIGLLEEYAYSGSIVIVATHDQCLIKKADTLYSIKNKQLFLETRDELGNTNNDSIVKEYKISLRGYIKYWKKMDMHHLMYTIIMTFIIGASIVSTIFGYSFFSSSNENYQDSLNDLSSREVIVYKAKYQNDYYSFGGHEFPFTNQEIQKLSALKHVDKINWRYDANQTQVDIFDSDNQYDFEQRKEVEMQLNTVVLEDKNNIVSYTLEEGAPMNVHGFDERIDFSSKIKYQYSKEGIYLSNNLFKSIFKEDANKLENPYLTFTLMIPQYNSTGYSWHITLEEEQIPVNQMNGKLEIVKLPIAGVLSSNALNHEEEDEYNHIYISTKLMDTYIKENLPTKTRSMYWIDAIQQWYIDTLPTEIDIMSDSNNQIITQVPYAPTAYSLIVDNVQNVNSVVKEIKKLGFSVESQYVNSQYLMSMDRNNQQLLIITGLAIIVVLYVFYLYLKYLHMIKDRNFVSFLKNLGLSNKQVGRLNRQRWIYNGIKLAVFTSVLLWMAIEILGRGYYIIIRPSMLMYGYIIVIAFIIEVLYPMVMKRWCYHD